jgi:hypothetical protein
LHADSDGLRTFSDCSSFVDAVVAVGSDGQHGKKDKKAPKRKMSKEAKELAKRIDRGPGIKVHHSCCCSCASKSAGMSVSISVRACCRAVATSKNQSACLVVPLYD